MSFWAGLAAVAVSFAIAALATPLSRHVAQRLGMLDVPSRHKTHLRAVPLLGGGAIFGAILGPAMLWLALASFWATTGIPAWLSSFERHIHDAAANAPAGLGILLGAMVLHVVGIIDDKKNLGPYLKLAVQFAVAAGVVLGLDVKILTALGEPLSSIASILWLVAIINAFNFLDNMDGLSAGVAAICAAGLLAASASVGQPFVSGLLCLMLGSFLGFLIYNFPPASTFMGDAGSLVIGYLMGVTSMLATYVQPGQKYYAYGIFVPLVVLAVPIYDTISVIVLRIRDRASPLVGDMRHFSHRLVRRGMSPRKAVLTIYLCTAQTAIAAIVLTRVQDVVGASLVAGQTAAMLLIVALLESGEARHKAQRAEAKAAEQEEA